MSTPNYMPHEEGPLFPDDAPGMVDDLSVLLSATDRDVEDAVARQNMRDMSETSFKAWLKVKLNETDTTSHPQE